MGMEDLMQKLNKDHGEVATRGDLYPKAEFISSGVYSFDAITGGGFARGHMTEIHALEGAGKTTLALQAIAYNQKQGMLCAFVDAERRLDPDRVEALGVDLSKLILLRPKYGEQACEIMRDIIESGEVDLLVLDSLPALSSKSETESTDGGGQIANHAKMWAQFLRKIIPGFDNRKTALVVVNQMRENMEMNPYKPGAKDPFTFPGGKAQKYHASNRVEIKKMEKATEFGYKAKFKSVKTSFTKPFMEIESFFDWDKGFLQEGDVLDMAIRKGVIDRDGAAYTFAGEKVAHGEKKARVWLEENLAKVKELL